MDIEFIIATNLSLFSPGVDRPPKLPPRDTALYGPSLWAKPNAAQAQAAAAAGLPKKGAKKSSGGERYTSLKMIKHRFWFKIFIDQLNKVHDDINKSKQYGWKD